MDLGDIKKIYVCGVLAWLNQMQSLFLLYPQFHGSQRTKQLEIFEFSRADSNTFPLLNITVGKVKISSQTKKLIFVIF